MYRSFFINTWCVMKAQFNTCRQNYNGCLSTEKQNAEKKDMDDIFDEIEKGIQENSIPDFSFTTSC